MDPSVSHNPARAMPARIVIDCKEHRSSDKTVPKWYSIKQFEAEILYWRDW